MVQPDAAAMIESLRAFGYSTPSAVADLIDNSISAGSRNVWVTFFWDGIKSHVIVRDDGRGMNSTALRDAMRPGSRNPLEARDVADLGRYGLGLKTASFSQCRRLTVASRTADTPVEVRRWDLDYVNRTSEWRLLKTPAAGSERYLKVLEGEPTGTIVLWEEIDRIAGGAPVGDRRAHERFLRVTEETERHLGMIFHRFLEGPGRISIYVNGEPVHAWDPFMTRAPATQWLGEEVLRLRGQEVVIQPFVLPHHSKLERAAHSEASGPAGWNAQQGFYVYRSGRLLVAGDWLGLSFAKEEHYKLARIRVDIPNAMDHDWHIDVRKSRARPPGVLREDFVRIARVTRERAVAIYRHRGKVVAHTNSAGFVQPWQRRVKHGKIFYRVNRDHPLVGSALDATPDRRRALRALLRLLEETVPSPLIAIDHAEKPGEQAGPFERAPAAEVREVLMEVYRVLRAGGASPEAARERILGMEPFRDYPELVASIDDTTETERR